MKLLVILLISLLGGEVWGAEANPTTSPAAVAEFHAGGAVATSPGKERYGFGWPDWFRNYPHPPKMEVSPQGGELSLTYWGDAPADLEVQRVEANVLSTMDTSQFAIEGNIRYTKVAPGSYLEMWSYFAPEKEGDPPVAYVTRTLADSGLMARIEGNTGDVSATRRFQIPFDSTGAKTHLQRIIFRLHLGGGYGTTLQFDSVKFVEYPNGHFPAAVASVQNLSSSPNPPEPVRLLAARNTLPPATPSGGIDGRSFLLGAAATSLALLAIAGLIFLSRLWQRRYHERELRRIASLDS